MASRFLTANFDNTQTLIDTNPQSEDNLINEYINLIIQNKNNSRFVRGATYRDNDNMPNIKIMNNFQRYGPDGNEQPIIIPTTTTHNVITGNLPPLSYNMIDVPPFAPTPISSSNLTLSSSPPSLSNLTQSSPPPSPSPSSSNLTLSSSSSSPSPPPSSSNLTQSSPHPPSSSNLTQNFRNRETFQNYYNNYINGGFKEYYHI
jgi:hypothetical protein